MLSRVFSIILLLCFFANVSHAQRRKKDVQVIVFDDENEINRDEEGRSRVLILKTSPLSYIAGWQFMELEKEVNDFFSIQGGLGITFKPFFDVESTLYSELIEQDCESELWGDNNYCDDFTDLDIRTFKPGLYISVTPRLYFDDFAPEDSYFGLKIRYSVRNNDVQKIEQGGLGINRLPNDLQAEKVRNFDIVGHYGYQVLYKKLTAAYFIGLGVRLENQTRQDLGYDDFGRYYNGERELSGARLRVEAGVRLGFQL
jgi:hypothetical protein